MIEELKIAQGYTTVKIYSSPLRKKPHGQISSLKIPLYFANKTFISKVITMTKNSCQVKSSRYKYAIKENKKNVLTTLMSASFPIKRTSCSPTTFLSQTFVRTTSSIMFLHNFSFSSTCNIIQMTLIAICPSIASTDWSIDSWTTFWTY